MKSMSECVDLSYGELQQEVLLRRQLQQEMVGSLYPRVLEGEIEELYNKIEKLLGQNK